MMRKVLLIALSGLSMMCQAQFNISINGEDTLCIGQSSQYSVEVDQSANQYLYRDTTAYSSGGNGFFALATGYDYLDITNTFTYDLWVKPTRTINMSGESNVCAGGVSVPLANSNQNWAIVPSGLGDGNMSVGLTIGTNGLMVGEHSGNILVSRLSYTVPITDWVHVAIVYNTDNIYLFLDGELVRSRPTHCPDNLKCLAVGLTGYYYGPDFKGDFDEFRLWDIPLTAEQILEIKDKKIINQVDGLRYYASFDDGKFERTLGDLGDLNMTVNQITPENHIKKSTWELNSYTGPDIDNLSAFSPGDFNYQWSTGETTPEMSYSPADSINLISVEASNNGYLVTDTFEIIGLDCGQGTYYDTIIIYDTIYTVIPGGSISPENLVSYYPFNGNAIDFGISGNDGIVNGSILTTDRDGNENSAYYFDGIADHIVIPDSLHITNDFTISFWAFNENAQGYSNIISDGSSEAGGADFLINFRDSNIGIRADKYGKPLNYEDHYPAELSGLDIIDKWVHVTWAMTPSYSKVYLNGEEIAHIDVAGTNLGYHDPNSYIGARHVWGSPDYFFKGKLDEIKIYNTALDDNQIKALFLDNPCVEMIFDTVTTEVFDTTYVAVSDTLKIDVVFTDYAPPYDINTIKVYPNPAKDHLFINTGNFGLIYDYRLKIIDQRGVTVFETYARDFIYEVNLSSWTGIGLYYLQVIDPDENIIDIKKIVLQ